MAGTDILLVQPWQGEKVRQSIFQPGVEIPLNIACLAAYLGREGISSEIVDLRLYGDPLPKLVEALTRHKPRLVGISAFSSEAENAKKVVTTVKAHQGETMTVMGGHHASAMVEEILRQIPELDMVVHGEGEITLTEVFRQLVSSGDTTGITGTSYREGEEVVVMPRRELIDNLSELPFPARDKLELAHYVPSSGTGNYMRLPTTGIMASRGCPYRCNYCSKQVWHNTIRFRSEDHVLAELEHCMEKYGIYDYRFYDDGLTLSQWDLKYFCEEIIRRGLDISWNCYSRVNHINEEKLRLMKASGCYHIKYGIEFGTAKALELANKGARMEQAREAVRLTKKVGLECKGNFMLGIPGETLEDCQATVAFALELSPDLATFYPFELLVGSEFYKRQEAGDRSIGQRLPREVTQRLSNRAYLKFYFRPRYVGQRLKRLIKSPRREMKVLGSGLLMMGKFFLKKLFGG